MKTIKLRSLSISSPFIVCASKSVKDALKRQKTPFMLLRTKKNGFKSIFFMIQKLFQTKFLLKNGCELFSGYTKTTFHIFKSFSEHF